MYFKFAITVPPKLKKNRLPRYLKAGLIECRLYPTSMCKTCIDFAHAVCSDEDENFTALQHCMHRIHCTITHRTEGAKSTRSLTNQRADVS